MITALVTFLVGVVVGAVSGYLVLRRHNKVRAKLDSVVNEIKR